MCVPSQARRYSCQLLAAVLWRLCFRKPHWRHNNMVHLPKLGSFLTQLSETVVGMQLVWNSMNKMWWSIWGQMVTCVTFWPAHIAVNKGTVLSVARHNVCVYWSYNNGCPPQELFSHRTPVEQLLQTEQTWIAISKQRPWEPTNLTRVTVHQLFIRLWLWCYHRSTYWGPDRVPKLCN